MAQVPEEWQNTLGVPYLTGQAAIPIVGRTSSGPAAFGFDPDNLGDRTAPVTPFVYYPVDRPLGPLSQGNRLFNMTSQITGIAFVPKTRSILFFGHHGLGEYCYGGSEECRDPANPYKGPHSVGGKYEAQVWAYDAEDFASVRRGRIQPWQVRPYDVWNYDLRFELPNSIPLIVGVALDAAKSRLFISLYGADPEGPSNPIIHAFDVVEH